ncbi:hypothetical protein ACFLRT_02815 [Acidobacteriota bacterium]
MTDNIKEGKRIFLWTLLTLIVLILAYTISHVITIKSYKSVHYEVADLTGGRQGLLVSVAVLENQLKTPTAVASPAIHALIHDLEESVIRAGTKEKKAALEVVADLFKTAEQELTKLGIDQKVSQKILDAARKKANEFVSLPDENKREVQKELLKARLEMAKAWALDALGAPALLERVGQLKEKAAKLGYGADSKVVTILTKITSELAADQPNRRLVEMWLGHVTDETRGSQSLFWGHSVLRLLEVIAWSLAGILLVRLWITGKFIATGKFESKWNLWWLAKIIQAPLLAIGVVLALSYFELGLGSGETLGIKVSLRGQPIEFVVVISFLLGLFSDRAFNFFNTLADKMLDSEGGGKKDKPVK